MKFDAFGNPIPEFGPQDLLRPLGPMNYPETKTINPVVANYLKNKLAPPQPTSAPTQPISASLTQPTSTLPAEVLPQDATEETLQDVNPWVKFAAGAGAAIAGRDPNEAISYFDRLRQTELNRLEQNRRQKEDAARRAEDVDFRNKQAASEESFRQRQLQMQDAQRRDSNQMQAKAAQEKLAAAQSPQGKLEKLNSSDRTRFDNVVMVLKGLDEMSNALNSGQNTFSLVGDNDYTDAARRATEAFGRMQSQGAINKGEEARFEKVLPQVTDSAEMQRKKIQTQRNEMLSRLKTLGFSPEELGLGGTTPTETSNEIERIDPKTGRTVIYDAKTKQPLRWK